MRKFLKKRWHGIPVGIVAAVLLVCLLAGGVLAGYGFFQATMNVEVQEAVYPSYGWDDDLSPYMAHVDGTPSGGVLPLVVADPPKFRASTGFSVVYTIKEDFGVDASELVAGEALVIPFNIRNRGDAPLTMTTSYILEGPIGVYLEYAWETNPGPGPLNKDFKAIGPWDHLDNFSAILAPHGGSFGSAAPGATVLFIKVTVPDDAPLGSVTLKVTFTRG